MRSPTSSLGVIKYGDAVVAGAITPYLRAGLAPCHTFVRSSHSRHPGISVLTRRVAPSAPITPYLRTPLSADEAQVRRNRGREGDNSVLSCRQLAAVPPPRFGAPEPAPTQTCAGGIRSPSLYEAKDRWSSPCLQRCSERRGTGSQEPQYRPAQVCVEVFHQDFSSVRLAPELFFLPDFPAVMG